MATLVSHVTDLVGAIRTKLNLMTPRLLPVGGSVGQIIYKSGSADGAAGWTTPPAFVLTTVTVVSAYEWTQTVADATLLGTETIAAWLAPALDSDENVPEMLDIVTLTATASAGNVTFTLTFSELTTGIIKLAYKVQ